MGRGGGGWGFSPCRRSAKSSPAWIGLTLSSPGFLARHSPGGGGGTKCLPHHNFFVIGRIMLKLGKNVKCYKLYLLMGCWWVNWL